MKGIITCLRAGPTRQVCKRGMGRASSFLGHRTGVRKGVAFVTRDINFLARLSKCGTCCSSNWEHTAGRKSLRRLLSGSFPGAYQGLTSFWVEYQSSPWIPI
jgi:hypothetical protein